MRFYCNCNKKAELTCGIVIKKHQERWLPFVNYILCILETVNHEEHILLLIA